MIDDFKQVKKSLLNEITAVVQMEEIPPELVLNCDQTGIKIVHGFVKAGVSTALDETEESDRTKESDGTEESNGDGTEESSGTETDSTFDSKSECENVSQRIVRIF